MKKLSYDEGKVSRKNKLSGRMRLVPKQTGRNGLGLFSKLRRGIADGLKNQSTRFILIFIHSGEQVK